jgi:hypothetical protein
MALEITASASLQATKNGASTNRSATTSLTMAGDDMIQTTQVIGTSAEALAFGEIAGVPAYVWLRNTDAANYVELATDSGMSNKFAKLLAGEVMLFPPSSATIYALANTAAVRLEIVAEEA